MDRRSGCLSERPLARPAVSFVVVIDVKMTIWTKENEKQELLVGFY